AEDGLTFISPDDLAMRLARRERERNLYVLDVRTADEYAAGHVAGAVWAPGGQAVQATDEYVAVRAASIVLVCDGFARSVMTASWLRRMGFPDVAVLAGGLPAWTAAGGAVEREHPTVVPFGGEAARQRGARGSPSRTAGRGSPTSPTTSCSSPTSGDARRWSATCGGRRTSTRTDAVGAGSCEDGARGGAMATATYTLGDFIADLDRITRDET